MAGVATSDGECRAYFDRHLADVDQSGGCWNWPYARTFGGYGVLWVDGKLVRVHRLAFHRVHGRYPRIGRHSCDNPPCFNPAHIQDGTMADNMADMAERGRSNRGRTLAAGWAPVHGEEHPNTNLNADQIREIRRRLRGGERQVSIAAAFGIHQGTVSRIKLGKVWAHVADFEAVR